MSYKPLTIPHTVEKYIIHVMAQYDSYIYIYILYFAPHKKRYVALFNFF